MRPRPGSHECLEELAAGRPLRGGELCRAPHQCAGPFNIDRRAREGSELLRIRLNGILLLAVLLLGCPGKWVRVTATDYTTKEFTVCGTKFANTTDLDEEAAKQQCKAPPK